MWDRLQIRPGFQSDSTLPRAAVLVALFEDESGDVRVILTKRPDTMPTHAGHISFPGGRPDPGDDGVTATALREAEEEVGIDPSTVEVLGFLPEIHTFEYQLLVVPVVGRLSGIPQLRPSEREVARVLVPRLVDLADPASWKSELWGERLIWFYEVDGEILWGATAHMMRNLLGMTP
jgi:8-oxo-dGTP pyrophosphatase MutT (NUDIX family)